MKSDQEMGDNGRRTPTLEENLKRIDNQLQSFTQETREEMDSIWRKLEDSQKTLEDRQNRAMEELHRTINDQFATILEVLEQIRLDHERSNHSRDHNRGVYEAGESSEGIGAEFASGSEGSNGTSTGAGGISLERENWIQHCSHSEHTLKEVYTSTKFKCQVCMTEGEGMRYRCDPCNFEVHTACGMLPDSLSSFTHPQHQLLLRPTRFLFHKCSFCGGIITGMEYRCEYEHCQFFLHPTCSLLRELEEDHPSHPPHPLRLRSLGSKKCDACGKKCKNWRYNCQTCDVHIHAECLVRDNPTASDDHHHRQRTHGCDKEKTWRRIGRLADLVQLAQAASGTG